MKNRIEKKSIYYFIANYKPNDNNKEKVKILDKKFIKKNRNKCKIIYKNKIYELREYFEDIDINYNHKDIIKFKLIFIHNIIDMSYILYDCGSLISLYDNNKTNLNISYSQIYTINMRNLFSFCYSLKSLPDISKWNTSKVNNISHLFSNCKSLKSLPDIS